MGKKSNFSKKQDFLIKYLKSLEKNMNRKTYLAYSDDINFNKTTINQLNKIEKDLALIPKYSKNLKKADIKNIHQKHQDEVSSILNAGGGYADEVFENKLIQRTANQIDKYKNKFGGEYNGINFYFREYENDDFNKLNIFDGELIIPNESFIRLVIVSKLMSLRDEISKKLQLHTYITIKYKLSQYDEELGAKVDVERYFNSSVISISSNNQINQFFNIIFTEFLNKLEEDKNSSNLTFEGVMKLKIKINLEKSVFGKSYIDLPTIIKTKQACVNPKNDDDKCFKWCLLIAKHYNDVKNNDRNNTKYYKKYWENIKEPANYTYPVNLHDVPLFEELNDMKINVYEMKENDIYPVYTSMLKNINVVNLLLIHDETKSHYIWIKDLSRLLSSKTSHYKKHICSQCLTASYDSEAKLKVHMDMCLKHEACCVELPRSEDYVNEKGKLVKANNIMKFKNHGNDFMHPFHVIADFESTLLKVDDKYNQTAKKFKNIGIVSIDEEKSTQKYQKHVPNSYGLKYNCIHDIHSEPVSIYNDADPEKVRESFILELERLALKSYELTQLNKSNDKIIMTIEQQLSHSKNKSCDKCKCSYSKKNNKVRHHDHITGEFISSICYDCNINMQYKTFLPVYIHNLKGYDSHLFISILFKYGFQCSKSNNISCIPNNEERYISFSKMIKVGDYYDIETSTTKPIMYEIRFLDSIAFMNASIESLAQNLKDGCNNDVNKLRKVFKNTSNHFKDDQQFLMMTEKGVYPYDYIDSFDKMYDDKLPRINKFYSRLNNSRCSKEDYEKAQDVWNCFKCKSFLDYHNVYLVSDVLLLTDIWENFRSVCYKMYNLDCEYYYTSPGLSFDAMLKYTKQELELITDLDQYLFVENGIRGGVSQISTRHAISNNKYMSSYDKTKDDSYIFYGDANNLYGYGMSTYLPTDSFKWNDDEWNVEKIMSLNDEATTGYLFEVDLKIPEAKHDYFNDYPLCPENISIKKSDLNVWQQENYKETNVKKLCLTLYDKKKYIINYRYLKLVLSLGYQLENIHRVLQYSQSNFLKRYINLNTNARKNAKNEFEKDFFKLMNNSVYGKTMENVRKRIDFRLIRTEEEALRVKNLNRWTQFDESLIGLHIQKQKVILNKPIYLYQ